MLTEYLVGKTIYQDSLPSEVSAFVQRHVGMHRLTSDNELGRAMLRHTILGSLGLSIISYGGEVTVENPVGIESFHFQLVMSGECRICAADEEMRLTRGWATLINPSVPSSVTYSPDCTKLIVNIPKSLFVACSIDRSGSVPSGGVQFDAAAFLLNDRSTTFRTVELLFLEAEEKARDKSAVQPALELLFATKLLESFPNNVVGANQATRMDRFFQNIDRFIDANIKADISAVDISTLCNVSLRTLYERFTLYKGVTPTAYIKDKKLRKIYACLSRSESAARSVSEIAFDYGFNHLGRFSAEYKAVFGELPSDTLRRGRIRAN